MVHIIIFAVKNPEEYSIVLNTIVVVLNVLKKSFAKLIYFMIFHGYR